MTTPTLTRPYAAFAAAALALALALAVSAPSAAHARGALICDARDFGAQPDDDGADTAAIQEAVDACKDRGGTVSLGAGVWRSGTLALGSNMTLRLEPGARLTAIPDIDLYPMQRDPKVPADIDSRISDSYPEYQAFVFARGVENLIIEGGGALDGQGELFWEPNFYALDQARPELPRPQQMVEFVDCRNVTVRDITVTRSPAYSVRFYGCDGVRAENITVRNDPRSPNTDGIQVRDSRNVLIRGADIDTGDDAIVVKSHYAPVENLVVADSILASDDAAMKFGTAGYVGVRNAQFSNILVTKARTGVGLFQMDGGRYEDVRFTNITMTTGGRGTRFLALYADIDKRTGSEPWGAIERLTFSDIDLTTTGNVLIAGNSARPIRDLTLRNITVRTPDGVIPITETRRKPKGNAFVSETGEASENFANVNANVTLANIDGLVVDGLTVSHGDADDPRQALALVHVRDAAVSGVTVREAAVGDEPAITVEGGRGVRLRNLALPMRGDAPAPVRATDVERFSSELN